jgi:PadR family transcriptional regulator, regulatory protein PadR
MTSSDPGPKRVTLPTLQVLDLFLADLARDDWYALDISRKAKLSSGTVTQVMFRLEQWGWVESRWEQLDDTERQTRPRRRFYQLTGLGQRSARDLVAARFPGRLGWNPG